MNIHRAGPQQLACWKSEMKLELKMLNETNGFGILTNSYEAVQAAIRGHATGWIAAVAWMKRQSKKQK